MILLALVMCALFAAAVATDRTRPVLSDCLSVAAGGCGLALFLWAVFL